MHICSFYHVNHKLTRCSPVERYPTVRPFRHHPILWVFLKSHGTSKPKLMPNLLEKDNKRLYNGLDHGITKLYIFLRSSDTDLVASVPRFTTFTKEPNSHETRISISLYPRPSQYGYTQFCFWLLQMSG